MRNFKSKIISTVSALSLVALGSFSGLAYANEIEVNKYHMQLMAQTFDGHQEFSNTQTSKIARYRKGNQSYTLMDFGDGSVVIEGKDRQLSVGNFENTTGVEAEFLYNYDTKTLSGDNDAAEFFNRHVRQYLGDAPKPGEDATWEKTVSLSSLGIKGVSGTQITISFSREYFTHDDKDYVLLQYSLPAFAYQTGSGQEVVHWGEGVTVSDPSFGEIYWNATLQRALAEESDGLQRPYRFAKTMTATDQQNRPLFDPRRVPQTREYFETFYGGNKMGVIGFHPGPGKPDQSPILLSANLDVMASAIAENSANPVPQTSHQYLNGATGVNVHLGENATAAQDTTGARAMVLDGKTILGDGFSEGEEGQTLHAIERVHQAGSGGHDSEGLEQSAKDLEAKVLQRENDGSTFGDLVEQVSSNPATQTSTDKAPIGYWSLRAQGFSDDEISEILSGGAANSEPPSATLNLFNGLGGGGGSISGGSGGGSGSVAPGGGGTQAVPLSSSSSSEELDAALAEFDNLLEVLDPTKRAQIEANLAEYQETYLRERKEFEAKRDEEREKRIKNGTLDIEPVTFEPPVWESPEFTPPEWVPPEASDILISVIEFTDFSGGEDYENLSNNWLSNALNLAYRYDDLSGTVATDLSPWADWLATQNLRELERLALNAGYPNLASALTDHENLIRQANDVGYRQWAGRAPVCYLACANILGQWTIKSSQLALGDILNDSREIFSTAGLSDVSISGFTLRYLLRDFGLEDGDLINIVISQFGRSIFETELSLLNEGTDFEINLRPGVASIVITALNEGDISPNTAEITLQDVVEGDSTQTYSLTTGETATLRVSPGRVIGAINDGSTKPSSGTIKPLPPIPPTADFSREILNRGFTSTALNVGAIR